MYVFCSLLKYNEQHFMSDISNFIIMEFISNTYKCFTTTYMQNIYNSIYTWVK